MRKDILWTFPPLCLFKFAQFVYSICDVDVNTFCMSDHISVIFSVNVLN